MSISTKYGQIELLTQDIHDMHHKCVTKTLTLNDAKSVVTPYKVIKNKKTFDKDYVIIINKDELKKGYIEYHEKSKISKIARPVMYLVSTLKSIDKLLYLNNYIKAKFDVNTFKLLSYRFSQFILVRDHLYDMIENDFENAKLWITEMYVDCDNIIENMTQYYNDRVKNDVKHLNTINEIINNNIDVIDNIVKYIYTESAKYNNETNFLSVVEILKDTEIKEKVKKCLMYEFDMYPIFFSGKEVEQHMLLHTFDMNAIDKNNENLFTLAIKVNNTILVEFLLNNGTDLIPKSKLSSRELSREFFKNIYKEENNNLHLFHDSVPESILCDVIIKNEYTHMREILYNYCVNIVDQYDNTPSHFIHKINLKDCKELLEYKPNLNLLNDNGKTPLMVACSSTNNDNLLFLIENYRKYNINLETIGHNGKTVLFEAVERYKQYKEYNIINVIKALVKQGANINVVNKNGHGLLFHLMFDKEIELIEYFLNLNIKTNEEMLSLANKLKAFDIMELLLNYGVKPSKEIFDVDNVHVIEAIIKNNPELLDEMISINIKSERKLNVKYLLSLSKIDTTPYLHDIANFNFDTTLDENITNKQNNRNEIFNLLLNDRVNITKKDNKQKDVLEIIQKNQNHVLFKSIREFNVKSRL